MVVNEGGQGQKVEEIGKEPPDVGVAVFSKTFVIEAVYLTSDARKPHVLPAGCKSAEVHDLLKRLYTANGFANETVDLLV